MIAWLKRNYLYFPLALAATFPYIFSFNNSFVSDDMTSIVGNPIIGTIKYLTKMPPLFTQPVLFNAIYKTFGLAPWAFRLPNILAHIGVVLLMFAVVGKITNNNKIGFLTALIIAVHPLQSEPVLWISGGIHVWFAFLLLLSFWAYIQKKPWWQTTIFYLLALTTSEKAMVFFPILVLYELCFGSLGKTWKKLAAPFFATLVWFIIFATQIPGRAASIGIDIPQAGGFIKNLFMIPTVGISSYLELIIWPKNLTLYHSETTFSKPEFIVRGAIVIAFVATTVFAYIRKHKQTAFWMAFFMISLLPVITPFGISWLVAERYAYLGAIGIYTLISYIAIRMVVTHPKLKIPALGITGVILIALTMRTINRSIDWKNQDNLWLAAAKTSPHSAQNRNNLGDYYARQGNLNEALKQFTIATELKPCYADAHHNLATTYLQTGNLEKAIKNYQKALECNPNLWQSQQNLNRIYQHRLE